MKRPSTRNRLSRDDGVAAVLACLFVLGIGASHHHPSETEQPAHPDSTCVLCHFHQDIGTGLFSASETAHPVYHPPFVLEKVCATLDVRRFLSSASPRAPPAS